MSWWVCESHQYRTKNFKIWVWNILFTYLVAEKGICQKYFPNQFVNEICSVKGDYYVTYKWSSTACGERVDRPTLIGALTSAQRVDNSWVVHYIPKLSGMVAGHLYIELFISLVRGIMYLFQCVCKRHDRVTVELISESGNCDTMRSDISRMCDTCMSRKLHGGFTGFTL